MNAAFALHPRPQLTRDDWTDLSGPWGFAHDDQDAGLRERWFKRSDVYDRTIVVPFAPESRASGLNDTGFHAVVWYRRTFTAVREASHDVLLHFGAVDYRAQVWVNGQLVAEHEGGHTPFSANITAALNEGGAQVVVVRAEDEPEDLFQPRGKQDWQPEPHAIWYQRTTGIWQTVWLERVPELSLQSLRWTPDVDRLELRLNARLSRRPPAGARLHVRLTLRGQLLAEHVVTAPNRDITGVLPLHFVSTNPERDDILWSPRRPNLIEAQLTLLAGDEVVDHVRSYAGMRSVGVQGGRFLLNGLSYYLRLVLAQNYWPESHLSAPDADALRREAQLIKDLGFNGVRVHQKVEDPRFLYWCDRLGLLVWGEMPSAYGFSPQMCVRLTREWLEVVERDFSHPCIVTWVPLNESWGVPNLEGDAAQRAFARGLYHLTKTLDPTRPVVANDGWQFVAGDLLGVHDYAPHGDTLLERYATHADLNATLTSVQPYFRNILTDVASRGDAAVVLSEFGGLSLAPAHSERWFGYGTVKSGAELLARYEELLNAVLRSNALAGFCYTQLTDTEQETNGLLNAERAPKLDVAALRAINSRFSRAVPGDVLGTIHQDAQDRHGAPD